MKINLVSSALLASALFLSACAEVVGPEQPAPAEVIKPTKATSQLEKLPAPSAPIYVAVYEFPDLTGQNKPNSDFAEYSRAVTQGGDAILVDVLEEAGNRKWFKLVERRGVNNVLRERQLIMATRQQFSGENAEPLPAMSFAGVLLEGGVIAYDSNIATGGVGARYLGIGANTEFRIDQVTVNLRAVSVQSGEILSSVTTTKTIYSTALQGSVFKFVGTNELLELEAGVTENEPAQFALREAIEVAVYALILEGAENNVWRFRSATAQNRLIAQFEAAQKKAGPLPVSATPS